ncbi:MAG: glyoxylate/hydroxypyruvate reductase A [Rhodobacteraceae bacterium]|nr:glyoxylate/hydroxypyruvate reductase A [Paracoccaceae bacterium]
MIKVQFAAGWPRWKQYEHLLSNAMMKAGLQAELSQHHDPEEADYIVYAPNRSFSDFSPYVNTRAVLSLWAGVEDIVTNQTLTQPLTRMVDSGMTEGMVEYVTGHVLRHHLGMDAHIVNPDHQWVWAPPPLARSRRVAVLGLGELGGACAKSLSDLKFNVTGWSRNPKRLRSVTCRHGQDGLRQTLAEAEILVLLLPLTAATDNLINAETLGLLPKAAVIINPGRGQLIDDAALLAALDAGRVAHATLDVFRVEPLPPDHGFWAHPQVTVTPHIASETRAETASQVIAENIRRCEAGEPLLHLVDRSAGY